MLPFEGSDQNGGLFERLTQLLNDVDRFECIVDPGVQALANVLMLKRAEFEALAVSETVAAQMKSRFRALVKGNGPRFQALKKKFQKPALQKRFMQLLK